MSALNKQTGGNHYKDYAIQPIEYAQRNRLNALEANIVKYVTRHQDKGKALDIQKIIHCAQLILQLEYADKD
jgi:hypothetical protein